jgi:hypothetical protein
MDNSKWSDKLAFDVALRLEGSGDELNNLLDKHHITTVDLLALSSDGVFLKQVANYRDEIHERGLTFRLKARAQAEELLLTSWKLIHAPEVSPTVKADLIKSTVKWAGLEPKDGAQTGDAGGGVKITINLGASESSAKLINEYPTGLDSPA